MSTIERGSPKEEDARPPGQVQPLCCPRPEMPSAPGLTHRSTATLYKHSQTWHLAASPIPILRIFSCSITRPIDRKHSTHPWAGLCTRVCLMSARLSGPRLSCRALSQLLGEAPKGRIRNGKSDLQAPARPLPGIQVLTRRALLGLPSL